MKKYLIYLLLMLLPVSFCEAQKNQPKLKTDIDTFSYCLGILIYSNIKASGIEEVNPDIFAQALKMAVNNEELLFDDQTANNYLMSYQQKLIKQKAEKNLKIAEEFLKENKNKEGVVELESGLQYIVLKEGEGESPSETDKVTTHYHGTLIDGTVFDSSVERGQPAQFGVNQVIEGWIEALQLMKTGSKWKLFIPPHLAYGEQSPPGSPIGPNSLIIFEVELISIDE